MAQVTLDGTANPDFAGPLQGPDYQIGEKLGRRAGPNLFHSFERFDLRALADGTIESATFSGSPAIANIISRVTGGDPSAINGVIRSTIDGADFFFLNPAGVMFGPNAELNLLGSFHVSTADELRFANGEVFSARLSGASSFSVATPEAFGFLGAEPAAIAVDRSTLEVPIGETFSIVGGEITIDGGNAGDRGVVRAEAGPINLFALDSWGEADLSDGRLDAARLADITLADQAHVDASGDGGGRIRIRGGRLTAGGGSIVSADNTGATDAAGGLDLLVDELSASGGSQIRADVVGSGRGGQVIVQAGRLELLSAGEIRSEVRGGGDGRLVRVSANEILISGADIEAGRLSNISSEVGRGGEGNAGEVRVTGGDIQISDSGTISSSTFDAGDAGNVSVEAQQLTITSFGSIRSGSDVLALDGIAATGEGGSVNVKAGELGVTEGGAIFASTFTTGDAGAVVVQADRLLIDGRGSPTGIASDAGFIVTNNGQVQTAVGDAGPVTVSAGEAEIRNAGAISSTTFGQGDAGTITVEADRLLIDGQGRDAGIASETRVLVGNDGQLLAVAGGDAGSVGITAGELTIRNGGLISSTTFSRGDAGTVTVAADRLLIDGEGFSQSATGVLSDANLVRTVDGRVVAVAQGRAGPVAVSAGNLEIRNAGQISSNTFGPRNAGGVTVAAERLLIDGEGASPSATGIQSNAAVFVDSDGQVVAAGGDAGAVAVTAGELVIRNAGFIISNTFGQGDAGTIGVEADRLLIDGQGLGASVASETQVLVGNNGQLLAVAEGDARSVSVIAGELTIRNVGRVSSTTFSRGNAGTVTVAADRLLIDGEGFSQSATGILSDANLARAADGRVVAVAQGRAGPVDVTAGNLEVRNAGQISSNTFGPRNAGSVTVSADRLLIDGQGRGARVASETQVFVNNDGQLLAVADGDAGPVTVTAGEAEIRNGGQISSTTFGRGNAGTVTVAADRLLIDGEGFSQSATGVLSDANLVRTVDGRVVAVAQGSAGSVAVSTGNLEIRNAGQVSSNTFGPRNAGAVMVVAERLLLIDGAGASAFTGIATNANPGSGGNAGSVAVNAGSLNILNRGEISSGTFAQGNAGTVEVTANRLLIDGAGPDSFTGIGSQANLGATGAAGSVVVSGNSLELRGGGAISSASFGPRPAGDVVVRAPEVLIEAGALLASSGFGQGAAGAVTVESDRLLLDRGQITTSSASAGGGEVRLLVEDVIGLRSSKVTTSVAGGDDPTAGSILIDPKVLVIDNSTIEADAGAGSGGNIRIVADNILVPEGDLEGLIARGDISASGPTEEVNGTVSISAPETDISGGLVVLDAALLDAASQLRQRCAARRAVGASSFTGVGRGGLPASPDGPLLSYHAPRAKPAAGSAVEIDERDQPKAAPGTVTLILPCRGPA